MPDLSRLLDFLRRGFPYFIALFLPLAGLVLAIVKFADGDHVAGARLAALAVLGGSLLLLLLLYN